MRQGNVFSLVQIVLAYAVSISQFVSRRGNGGPTAHTELCTNILNQLPHAEIQDRLVSVISYMKTLNLDITSFLPYVS